METQKTLNSEESIRIIQRMINTAKEELEDSSFYYLIWQGKQQRVQSYINEMMKYVLIAFLVSLFFVLVSMSKLGLATYPMVMLIYGMWLFVSGGALKFKPLIIGGIINWILAVAALFAMFQNQLIILAAAVLLGYIIPRHMLRLKFKKIKPS